MRPPGHSGKAKKGHLCFDAIYETGENILIDHLFILKNCLQEILEELISSTIMNMTCSFGPTLATLVTGNPRMTDLYRFCKYCCRFLQ